MTSTLDATKAAQTHAIDKMHSDVPSRCATC